MSEVLLLGNGISRLLHEPMIRQWRGELWAANYAYLEWGERLTRITGHNNVMAEAKAWRQQYGLTYKIMGRIGVESEAEIHLQCPERFRKDSGITLAAEALEEGFDRVLCCGYDLGGADLLSEDLHLQFKSVWVRRWRELLAHYGSTRVEFIGWNHLPYLLSRRPADEYQRRYRRGLPHIPDPKYIALHNLVFGRMAGWKEDVMVRVKWIVPPREGWETQYKESVARIFAGRGQVKILGPVKGEEPKEVAPQAEITAELDINTLRKIAKARGLSAAGTKEELVARLQGQEEEPEGDGDKELEE